MKHSMSTSSQCISPSTLLDEPYPDHAFDAPRLLRPSSVTPSRVPFEVPRLRGLRLGVPSPGVTLHTYCLLLVHLDLRSNLDPFTAFVTELPALLASSLSLDPALNPKATIKYFTRVVVFLLVVLLIPSNPLQVGPDRASAILTPIPLRTTPRCDRGHPRSCVALTATGMSGFLEVVGKLGTFLLWVLFLVLQTATKIVGSLVAAGPAAETHEGQHQEAAAAAAAARRRSPPASPHRGGATDVYDHPLPQLWDPPPYSSAPVADEYSSSSSYRRRASAPLADDVVVSSTGYSRPATAVASSPRGHSVSAPLAPLRAVETRSASARPVVRIQRPRLERKYSKIVDQYRSLDEVIEALAHAGLESSNLIIGIDFTKSNEWTGKKSFNGMSLHHIGDSPNPYEQAISIIGQTLSAFDEDNLIPCYGFGDASTHDQDVFGFYPDERPCNGFQEALARYREIVPHLRLSGPTSFSPIIEMATTIVEQSGGQYHVLVIIADGQVTRSVDTEFGQLSTQEQMTVDAIVQASEFPLSIILVGVGDGPWDMMKEFDDNIPARSFDNFQFVNFTAIMSKISQSKKETEFALSALMEIPLQYKATLELGILGRRVAKSPERVPLPPPFPSYNTISRAAPSRANSFRSMPYHPRDEAPVDSTVTASVTSPAAADTTASEPQICPVCLSKPRDMAFGCGHQTCSECGPQVEHCPICRRPIDTRVKLY
ncbi:hypothetical protein GUJ93_ZPchr0009g459 [Zizania palustris]|uniref:RING-type domain-containing protein n=1 Tax=Zizania palustris TaxID=103762 RepID=A0A8J5RQG7_ZIZPA|nr:hypothetical protein GUJ93_ZPchr0009g459 [Zizania palustris]